MSGMRSFACGIVAALGPLACAPPPAAAEADEVKNIASYTCKDVMRASGENRDIAIAFLQGYVLGTKGPKFDPNEIAAASDAFQDRCLDNPKSRALDVMIEVSE